MADISSLGNLQPVEALDLNTYKDSTGFKPLAPKGTYTLKAPEGFPAASFGRSKSSGALTAKINPTIVGGEFDGTPIRATISAKVFMRNGTKVSQFGDYFRAFGIRGLIADEQTQADTIEATSNMLYEAEVDWNARDFQTQFEVKGMENFPPDGNGGFVPYVNHPDLKDENGKPKRIWANLEITRFIPKVD